MDTLELTGKVALVTGSAGGIGEEIARTLATCGAAVAAVDKDEVRLKETVERLNVYDLRVRGYPTDVSSDDAVTAAVGQIERELGSIEVLVNAAGVLSHGKVVDLSTEDWLSTFAVNSAGVFYLCRATVTRMIPRGRGCVVTVTSNAAGTPRFGLAAYAASKAAATMFTKCLGLEVAKYGIRCNSVGPGSTDTTMLHGLWSGSDAARVSVEGKPDEFRVGIPLGRIAQPVDIANAVRFLVSSEAAHITMQHLTVDGGASLGT